MPLSAQVLDGEAKGLLGIQSALGKYELDAEKADRQIVWFEAIRIAPADKDPAALKQWLAVFQEANPSMVMISQLQTWSFRSNACPSLYMQKDRLGTPRVAA